MNRLIRLAVLLALACLLAACSGSDTPQQEGPMPGTPGAPQATPGEVSGQAMNSYLVGAVVCVDMDYSNQCDSNDPQSISGGRGAFSINTNNNTSPLLAMQGDTRLSSPAGATVVSPLSTLVNTRFMQNLGEHGMSRNDAHARAVQDLKDAMALEDVDPLRDDYMSVADTAHGQKLSHISSVMHGIMTQARHTARQAAVAQGLPDEVSNFRAALEQHALREAFQQVQAVAADVSAMVDSGQSVNGPMLAAEHAVAASDAAPDDLGDVLNVIAEQGERAKEAIEAGGNTEDEDRKVMVSAQAGDHGEITPSSVSVIPGNTTHFTVTPESGYGVESVSGCGGSLSDTTYITGDITEACTVEASFHPSDGLRRICVNGDPAGEGVCPEEPDEAGTGEDEWGCTLDGATDLMWAVNMFGNLLADPAPSAQDEYSWYDENQGTEGGHSGSYGNFETCNQVLGDETSCNTQNYIGFVNTGGGVCGSTQWRLPTREELLSLWGEDAPENDTIDDSYFPHFYAGQYLTSETHSEHEHEYWTVNPASGNAETRHKEQPALIWLVSDPTP